MTHPKLKRPTGPYIRKPWERHRSVTQILGESKTQAVPGNQTDVNQIMERFTRTGILPPPTQEAQYADVTELQKDLTEILERGREAQNTLDDLREEAKKRAKEHKENKIKQQENAQTAPEPDVEE